MDFSATIPRLSEDIGNIRYNKTSQKMRTGVVKTRSPTESAGEKPASGAVVISTTILIRR